MPPVFLNKCDILEAKLNSGIRFAKYVRSYGDRENSFSAVSKCEYFFHLRAFVGEAEWCSSTSFISRGTSMLACFVEGMGL